MYPLLRDGDIVYIKKMLMYSVGDIIAAEHPFRKTTIIKKIKTISNAGENPPQIELEGLDDTESEDSRSFGAIAEDAIVGKIVMVLNANSPSTSPLHP